MNEHIIQSTEITEKSQYLLFNTTSLCCRQVVTFLVVIHSGSVDEDMKNVHLRIASKDATMETKGKREDRFNGIRNITGNVVLMIRILRSFFCWISLSIFCRDFFLQRFLSSPFWCVRRSSRIIKINK